MVSRMLASGFLKMSKHWKSLKRLIWSYRIHFLDFETAFEFFRLNSSDFWGWFARNARAFDETSPLWPPPGMPRRSQASPVTAVTSHGTCVLCQTAGWDALWAVWTPASKSPGWAQACQRWEIGKCQVLRNEGDDSTHFKGSFYSLFSFWLLCLKAVCIERSKRPKEVSVSPFRVVMISVLWIRVVAHLRRKAAAMDGATKLWPLWWQENIKAVQRGPQPLCTLSFSVRRGLKTSIVLSNTNTIYI